MWRPALAVVVRLALRLWRDRHWRRRDRGFASDGRLHRRDRLATQAFGEISHFVLLPPDVPLELLHTGAKFQDEREGDQDQYPEQKHQMLTFRAASTSTCIEGGQEKRYKRRLLNGFAAVAGMLGSLWD